MKKMLSKGLVMAMVLGAGFISAGAFNTPVAEAATEVSVEILKGEKQAVVNWENTTPDIQAAGMGVAPARITNPTQASLMARRAAKIDALRNLAETVGEVKIDSESTLQDMALESDIVKTSVNAAVRGAQVIKEINNGDGSWTVIVSVPLYGARSVAAAAIPAVTAKKTNPEVATKVDLKVTTYSQAEMKQIKQAAYTGVIVDAAGLGLEPTFSPVIKDINGRAVYGMKNIDPNFAISKGMVEYSKDLQKATAASRAGSNPLVVKAVRVDGGANSVNMVNTVVSVDDADKILLANENSNMLSQCAVVFVR